MATETLNVLLEKRKTRFSRFCKAALLAVAVFVFFLLMSRIDYIVNSTLYRYGLQFSYDWALEYWVIYTTVFVVFSAALGITNWVTSSRTRKDTKISAALFLTILFLAIGGLQDILYFVFWAGGLPPISVVWWWAPLITLVGTWNSLIQVGFTTLMMGASVCTWLLATRTKQP